MQNIAVNDYVSISLIIFYSPLLFAKFYSHSSITKEIIGFGVIEEHGFVHTPINRKRSRFRRYTSTGSWSTRRSRRLQNTQYTYIHTRGVTPQKYSRSPEIFAINLNSVSASPHLVLPPMRSTMYVLQPGFTLSSTITSASRIQTARYASQVGQALWTIHLISDCCWLRSIHMQDLSLLHSLGQD